MNIVDYLKSYKNITFDKEPFNAVDGLVLAELIYAKFEGILDENSNLDIKEVNKAFWDIHTEKEINDQKSFTKYAPFLMKEMASSKRFKGTKFKHYVSDTSLKDLKQFAALTLELPDNTDFITYRGTDGTVAGWMEDFKFSYSTTEGQSDASDYLNKYHHDNKHLLRLGGHSKGANLAVYAGIFSNKNIKDRIKNIYSFDGPGFKDIIINSNEYLEILPRVISIIPKDCTIGIMMKNRYKTIITDSDNFFIMQHDAYAWHIVDNHFEELDKRGEDSLLFEKVLNDWMEKCDETKREKILDIFSSSVLNNDILFKDNEKLSSAFLFDLIIHSPKIDDEDKEIIVSSIKDFMSSATDIISNEFKNKFNELSEKIESEIKEELNKFKEKEFLKNKFKN